MSTETSTENQPAELTAEMVQAEIAKRGDPLKPDAGIMAKAKENWQKAGLDPAAFDAAMTGKTVSPGYLTETQLTRLADGLKAQGVPQEHIDRALAVERGQAPDPVQDQRTPEQKRFDQEAEALKPASSIADYQLSWEGQLPQGADLAKVDLDMRSALFTMQLPAGPGSQLAEQMAADALQWGTMDEPSRQLYLREQHSQLGKLSEAEQKEGHAAVKSALELLSKDVRDKLLSDGSLNSFATWRLLVEHGKRMAARSAKR